MHPKWYNMKEKNSAEEKMAQKTGYALFGGSFDPPHLGHEEIVKNVLKLDDIEGILIVPTYLNPFKSGFHASPKQRLEWCKSIFTQDTTKVIDYEIKQNRAVYTHETYQFLNQKYPIKAIVIGADNLKNITEWKNFQELNSKLEWIVASRPNELLNTSALRSFQILPLNINISSSQIREGKGYEFLNEKIKKQVLKVYNIAKN